MALNPEGIVQDESFVERRALYRGIWDAATHEVPTDKQALKPKVIKTLNLDRISDSAGQLKKQRIKNLRTVCKKVLDFCDRHEKEEVLKTQIAAEINKTLTDPQNQPEATVSKSKPNKIASKDVSKFELTDPPKNTLKASKAENIPSVLRKRNDELTEFTTGVVETSKTTKLSKRNQGDGSKKQKRSAASSAVTSMGPRKVLRRKSPSSLLKKFSYTGRRRIRSTKKKIPAGIGKDTSSSKNVSGSSSYGVTSKQSALPATHIPAT